jgi:hypothetical protein
MEPERLDRLRSAVRRLVQNGGLAPGAQSQLARYFHVTRQRVHQLVLEERARTSSDRTAT